MNITADRGGPFVRNADTERNWMRASPPGIAFRFAADESSPIGGACAAGPQRTAEGTMAFDATRSMMGSEHATVRRAGIARTDSVPGGTRGHAHPLAIAAIVVLAVAGVAAFGQGAYILAKAQVAQVLLHRAWERTRATGVPAKPWPWADTHPVARLTAPGRGADVLVLAGASGRTLAFGPGHLDGSAQPGDAGNAVFTAHRDTHFRFLRNVATGDEIVVERPDGTPRRFRIVGAYVADQRALNLPRDTGTPTLTLVTCYPFDALNPGGPLRYVVVAELVPPAAAPARPRAMLAAAGD